jgi:hypothetical protein
MRYGARKKLTAMAAANAAQLVAALRTRERLLECEVDNAASVPVSGVEF